MPSQSPNSPLSAFLQALKQEQIDCIQIGAMAAIQQGAPLMINGIPTRVLPLARIIASKRAADRDKDRAVLPILERTLRLSKGILPAAKRLKQKRAIKRSFQ